MVQIKNYVKNAAAFKFVHNIYINWYFFYIYIHVKIKKWVDKLCYSMLFSYVFPMNITLFFLNLYKIFTFIGIFYR